MAAFMISNWTSENIKTHDLCLYCGVLPGTISTQSKKNNGKEAIYSSVSHLRKELKKFIQKNEDDMANDRPLDQHLKVTARSLDLMGFAARIEEIDMDALTHAYFYKVENEKGVDKAQFEKDVGGKDLAREFYTHVEGLFDELTHTVQTLERKLGSRAASTRKLSTPKPARRTAKKGSKTIQVPKKVRKDVQEAKMITEPVQAANDQWS